MARARRRLCRNLPIDSPFYDPPRRIHTALSGAARGERMHANSTFSALLASWRRSALAHSAGLTAGGCRLRGRAGLPDLSGPADLPPAPAAATHWMPPIGAACLTRPSRTGPALVHERMSARRANARGPVAHEELRLSRRRRRKLTPRGRAAWRGRPRRAVVALPLMEAELMPGAGALPRSSGRFWTGMG